MVTLNRVPGTWDADPPETVEARWESSGAEEGPYVPVAGWNDPDTINTEIVGLSLPGRHLRVREEASNLHGSDVAHSAPWGPVDSPRLVPLGTGSRSIHSGHSLTDSYVQTGTWPGNLRRLAEANGLAQSEDRLIKSTIPGSPVCYRWENAVANNPSALEADARVNIAPFDFLVITEGGPPPRVTNGPAMADTLACMCDFAANLIENGAAHGMAMWSIWPALQGPGAPSPTPDWQGYTFRSALDEYERSFKYMADYVAWKIKQFYPDVAASGWFVFNFPGAIWMREVYDDIQNGDVPGITSIEQLFADDDPPGQTIHTNAIAGYGLSLLMLSCLYDKTWDAQTDTFPAEAGVTPELIEYFCGVANRVSLNYGPAGRGGAQGNDLEWFLERDGDPLPGWSPEGIDPEPGDLPEDFVVKWKLGNYEGPTPTSGAAPVDDPDGVTMWFNTEDATVVNADMQGMYVYVRFRAAGNADRYNHIAVATTSVDGGWHAPSTAVTFMGTPGAATVGPVTRVTDWDDTDPGPSTGVQVFGPNDAQLMEAWIFPDRTGINRNDPTLASTVEQVREVNVPETSQLMLFMNWGGRTAGNDEERYGVEALFIMDRRPTDQERLAIWEWGGEMPPI